MNWFYALGGQQQGPVDEAQLDALLAAGTIHADTLVWREGLSTWQPLRQARPSAGMDVPPVVAPPPAAPVAGVAPPGPGEVQCGECGGYFTRDNVIQYGAVSVCAACKPIFLQRLREGAAPSSTFTGAVSEDQLLAREYRIEIGDCLSRAWKLFSENAGIVIGVSLLVGVIYFGAAMAAGLIGKLIPLFDQIVLLIIAGPIAGGYFWFLLRLTRGESAGVGDAFHGFSGRFVQLMLSSLVQGLLNFLCLAPMFLILAIGGVSVMSLRGAGGGAPSFSIGLIFGLGVTGFLGILAVIYLSTIWAHSYFLVVDKGYNFWPAMQLSRKLVQKRWWMTFLLNLVGGIIAGAGILACGIGMIVTVPLYLAMRAWLYEDNFRDLARPEAT